METAIHSATYLKEDDQLNYRNIAGP